MQLCVYLLGKLIIHKPPNMDSKPNHLMAKRWRGLGRNRPRHDIYSFWIWERAARKEERSEVTVVPELVLSWSQLCHHETGSDPDKAD